MLSASFDPVVWEWMGNDLVLPASSARVPLPKYPSELIGLMALYHLLCRDDAGPAAGMMQGEILQPELCRRLNWMIIVVPYGLKNEDSVLTGFCSFELWMELVAILVVGLPNFKQCQPLSICRV